MTSEFIWSFMALIVWPLPSSFMAYSHLHQSSTLSSSVLSILTTHSLRKKRKSLDLWHLPVLMVYMFLPRSVPRLAMFTNQLLKVPRIVTACPGKLMHHQLQHTTGCSQQEWGSPWPRPVTRTSASEGDDASWISTSHQVFCDQPQGEIPLTAPSCGRLCPAASQTS